MIVPVYNVRPYLEEALDSVLHQTYRDLEIVVIDDGSDDGSGDICDRYAEKDERIRVIHQQNGGISAARNAGLDAMKGAYVAFLDSDDAFLPKTIETMLSALEREQADIAVCSYALCFTDKRLDQVKISDNGAHFPPGIYDRNSFLCAMVEDRPNVYVCTKIFRAGLWKSVRFPVGRVFEDVAVAFPIVSRAERICVLPDLLYLYRRHRKGITLTPSLKSFQDWLVSFHEYDAFVEENTPGIFEEKHLQKLHQHKMIQFLWEYAMLPSEEMTPREEKRIREMILGLGQKTHGRGCGFPVWCGWRIFRCSPGLFRFLCRPYYAAFIKIQEVLHR